MNKNRLIRNAQLAGFSKVIGTPNSSFVLLSRETDGRAGRKVFIDRNLAPKFAVLGSVGKKDSGSNSEVMMRQLYQLRSMAGGGQSFDNLKNAFEHMHIFGNLKVVYKVVMSTGGAEPAGVYITDIGMAGFSQGAKPGFYRVLYDPNQKLWEADAEESSVLQTKSAAINGLAKNLSQAASDIMPDMVEEAYGKRDGVNAIRNAGYTLFYNPQNLHDGDTDWYTPEQKQVNREYAAAILGNGMLDAQRRGLSVQWTVHGNGASLFVEAIQRMGGQKLDKHEVIFLSTPDDAHLGKVLSAVRSAGIRLHEDVAKAHGDDWSGLQNKTIRSRDIASEVEKFGKNYLVKADEIRSRGNANILTSIGWLKFAASLGAASLLKYQTLRNMAAVSAEILDPAINPHFHPFKDEHQLKAHANRATGGKANIVFFSELIKKLRRR